MSEMKFSINQSINQSVNQLVNQSINQPINQYDVVQAAMEITTNLQLEGMPDKDKAQVLKQICEQQKCWRRRLKICRMKRMERE